MGQKTYFYSFLPKVFENLISKNNFQRSDGFEYVSNLSHMIKMIILDGSYSHSDAYKSILTDSKKNPWTSSPKNPNFT